MKRKHFHVLSLLAGLAIAAAGCANAEKMAGELKLTLDDEHVKFQGVVQTLSAPKPERGEGPTSRFIEWTKKLGEVNGRVTAIAQRMSNPKLKAAERAGAETMLKTLQPRLDQVLSREGKLSLRFVPSWMKVEADKGAERVRATVLDLRRNYETLFRQVAPGSDHWDISLRVDQDLFDTYNDCVDSFKYFGAGRRDDSCATYGARYCTHQMDLRCVDRLLHLNGSSSCTVTKMIHSGTADSEIELPAEWLGEISRCVSASPVFRR